MLIGPLRRVLSIRVIVLALGLLAFKPGNEARAAEGPAVQEQENLLKANKRREEEAATDAAITSSVGAVEKALLDLKKSTSDTRLQLKMLDDLQRAITEMRKKVKTNRGIIGRVIDDGGKPIEGASVFLVGSSRVRIWRGRAVQSFPSANETPPEDTQVPAGRTDKEGRFSLTESAEQATQIAVTCRSLDLWIAQVPEMGEEATIRLPQPARLVMRYDIEGGESETTLHLERRGPVEFLREFQVRNKDQIIVEDLAPGSYELTRRRDGYFCDRRTVSLKAGERIESHFIRDCGHPVEVQLTGFDPAKATPRVRVLSGTATGAPNAHDELMTVFDGFACGGEGKHSTERLLPGTYTIAAEARLALTSDRLRVWGRIPQDFIGVAKVTVMADKAPEPVRIEMKPSK